MSRLQNKIAIVTGASRGIGRAIAGLFAREGASVVICGRKQDSLDLVARELNAGTNIAQGPALEMTDAQFDKMVEVNLKSAYRLTRLVAPGMCQRGSGSIVNIASIAGIRPQFQSLLYSMTKAALVMLTQSYALELGPRGVRVNAIAPGLVETTLSEYYWKDDTRFQPLMENQPIKHLGQPIEIAEIALMLAEDSTSYLTGQTIVVDGGRLLSSM